MKAPSNHSQKLTAYLAAGLGAGCLAGQVDAATVVTFYGPGSQNSGSLIPTPLGIDVSLSFSTNDFSSVDSASAFMAFDEGAGVYFTSGLNLGNATYYGFGEYFKAGSARNGAVLNSNQNYANISFNSGFGPYEAVGQFYFNGLGTGYLVALAVNSDNTALSISAGKSAIDAVPEPSSLALLALGAGGLIARRKRNAA